MHACVGVGAMSTAVVSRGWAGVGARCVAVLYSGHAGWHRWWWNETRSRCRFMIVSRVSVCVSVSPLHFSFASLSIYITVIMARHVDMSCGEPCISRARLSRAPRRFFVIKCNPAAFYVQILIQFLSRLTDVECVGLS